jgi:hypothetical protein
MSLVQLQILTIIVNGSPTSEEDGYQKITQHVPFRRPVAG